MAMTAEFKANFFEGMCIHTQLAMNAIWVTKDEFDHPPLTGERGCMVWPWTLGDLLRKKIH